MKVYVITAGEYSDYHICDVTIDPEQAEWLRRLHSGYNEAEIEVFETNEAPVPKLRRIWSFSILPDGSVVPNDREELWTDDPNFPNAFKWGLYNNSIDSVFCKVAAPDIATAQKIAFDKRAKMIAERFGL